MKEYHKIQTLFKRDDKGKLMEGYFTKSEFRYLSDLNWLWTEKVDGTNIRIMFDGETIRFGGRTDNAQIPAPLVNRLNEIFPDISKFKERFNAQYHDGVCFYGEGYGKGIQKGGGYTEGKLHAVDFILFDIKVDSWWLTRESVFEIARDFGIREIPVVLVDTIQGAIDYVKEGRPSWIGDTMMEGLVGRPRYDLFDRAGWRIITKLKYKDFQ